MPSNWGNYVDIDEDNPEPFKVCDYTFFPANASRTGFQFEFSAAGLYNTGFVVIDDFMDEPNPQGLAPPVYGDPLPVNNPRTFPPEVFAEDSENP